MRGTISIAALVRETQHCSCVTGTVHASRAAAKVLVTITDFFLLATSSEIFVLAGFRQARADQNPLIL